MSSTTTYAHAPSRLRRLSGTPAIQAWRAASSSITRAPQLSDHPHGPSGIYSLSNEADTADQSTSQRNGPHLDSSQAQQPPQQPPRRGSDREQGSPHKHRRRTILLGGAAALAATGAATAYWALNRFVIDHVSISNVAAYEAQNSRVTTVATADSSQTSITSTDGGGTYTSPTTSLTITRTSSGSGSDTITYYIADITVTDATSVRSAFANNEFGTNITATPSQIASGNSAVFAINGDYYGFRSDGILIRNGTIYRDTGVRDGIVFYTDGRVEVYDETTTDAQTLLNNGAWNTLSFGPALVRDGTVLSGIENVEVDTNIGNHSIQGVQPRTAIGAIGQGHYIFVVVDGRNEGYSRGMTMTELAQLMVSLGCDVAYNLDGGGSSAMYFNGSIINEPSNGGERATSDILYIATGA